ncbi:MAG: LD-carboxypeptidase [Elusimicrobiota bacterium]
MTILGKTVNVYLITPSWLIRKKSEFSKGIKSLEKLGFHFLSKKFIKNIPKTSEKVNQIHNAFLDKTTQMILAQRGGCGSMKLLPYLNFDLIRRNKKIFAGFSDISALLNVFYERCGLITLHSPMLLNFSKPSRFTVNSFINGVNGFPEKDLFKGAPVTVYKHGIAAGILKGGNLITLTALIGTKWEISTGSSILFFEDVDEKLHKIDRYLTQWILAGKLKKLKGLILGDFRGIKNPDVYKIITSQMKVKFPVAHCPYIGHTKNKITLPVGAFVKLDTHKKSLKIGDIFL